MEAEVLVKPSAVFVVFWAGREPLEATVLVNPSAVFIVFWAWSEPLTAKVLVNPLAVFNVFWAGVSTPGGKGSCELTLAVFIVLWAPHRCLLCSGQGVSPLEAKVHVNP